MTTEKELAAPPVAESSHSTSSFLERQLRSNSSKEMEVEDSTSLSSGKTYRNHLLRQAFRQRLSTYTPINFFAKPPSISPIVCARFGWQVMTATIIPPDSNENGHVADVATTDAAAAHVVNNCIPDVVTCVQCRASWNVAFPSSLVQGRAAARLTQLYQEQLSNQHHPSCRFYTEARLYYQELLNKKLSSTNITTMLLPLAMASVLPSSLRQLWEDMDTTAPQERFQNEWKAVCQRLRVLSSSPSSSVQQEQQQRTTNNHYLQWSWSLPDNVLQFDPQQQQQQTGSSTSSPSSLLTRIVGLIRPEKTDADRRHQSTDNSNDSLAASSHSRLVEELAVALILFGWSGSLLLDKEEEEQQQQKLLQKSLPSLEGAKNEDDNMSAVRCCRLECPFCLSVLELRLVQQHPQTMTTTTTAEQQRERGGRESSMSCLSIPKNNKSNLCTAHRYYCPFVCGFPVGGEEGGSNSSSANSSEGGGVLALWKLLALRLLQQQSPSLVPPQQQQESSTQQQQQQPSEDDARVLGPLEAYEQARKLLQSTVSPRVWKANKKQATRPDDNVDDGPNKRKRMCAS